MIKPIKRGGGKTPKSSIYYPIECPWPSPQSNRIRDAALDEYKRLAKIKAEIYLVVSQHWATEGYWIEFKKPKLSHADSIVKSKVPA